jgi:hypothetical protein
LYLPNYFLLTQYRALPAYALIAVFSLAAAAHAGTEAAAHSLLKAELSRRFCAVINRLQHGLRPAGVDIGVFGFGKCSGCKALYTFAAVNRSNQSFYSKSFKFVFKEYLAFGIEA